MSQGGWVGDPCDFSVSLSPFGSDFGTLDFGLWYFGLGLDNKMSFYCLGSQITSERKTLSFVWFSSEVSIKVYRNPRNLFVLNLVISSLLCLLTSVLCLPPALLQCLRTGQWSLGVAACKIVPAIQGECDM